MDILTVKCRNVEVLTVGATLAVARVKNIRRRKNIRRCKNICWREFRGASGMPRPTKQDNQQNRPLDFRKDLTFN